MVDPCGCCRPVRRATHGAQLAREQLMRSMSSLAVLLDLFFARFICPRLRPTERRLGTGISARNRFGGELDCTIRGWPSLLRSRSAISQRLRDAQQRFLLAKLALARQEVRGILDLLGRVLHS